MIVSFNRIEMRGQKFNAVIVVLLWKNNKYFDITIHIYNNHARLALFIAIQWNRINRNVGFCY